MAKFGPLGLQSTDYTAVWTFGKLRGFEWKMLLESKALLSNNFFHTNLLIFQKIQTVIKSHSWMMGAWQTWPFWYFRHAFFIVIAHNLMKSRSRDGLAAKGLEKVSSTTTTTTTTTTIMMNNNNNILRNSFQHQFLKWGLRKVFTPMAAFRLQDL